MPSQTFQHLPEEKRRTVIAALTAEFSEHPLSEAQVSRIVTAAKIPRGSFYVYFSDMTDAYRAALDAALAHVDVGLGQAMRAHPDDTLRAVEAYTSQFVGTLAHSQYRDLYTMHWLVNQSYLTMHHERIAHYEHEGADSRQVLIDGTPIADPTVRAAVFEMLMHMSHHVIQDVLNGEEPDTALSRFTALLSVTRAGLSEHHQTSEHHRTNQTNQHHAVVNDSTQEGDHHVPCTR